MEWSPAEVMGQLALVGRGKNYADTVDASQYSGNAGVKAASDGRGASPVSYRAMNSAQLLLLAIPPQQPQGQPQTQGALARFTQYMLKKKQSDIVNPTSSLDQLNNLTVKPDARYATSK